MISNIKVVSILAVLFGCVAGLAGCATLVSEPNQTVPISSQPSGADVTITDETGAIVFNGKTPATVTLLKSDGSYWGGKDYVVKVSKQGHSETVINIASNPSGWYLVGNIFFGGLIGWFIVDPLSGDMYTLSPKQITAQLGGNSFNYDSKDGSLSVVLLKDVPDSLRSEMQKIN